MGDGDFLSLLRERRILPATPTANPSGAPAVEGTTVLAVRFAEGVLIAGDRRATMGNTVVHDRADKVLTIDDEAALALSGSPAAAYEIARLLEMSFQHYRRTQLQPLSLEGKLRVLSRLLRDNLPLALQGIGAVVPIFAAFDRGTGNGRIYFCDLLGAQFESVDFCATGSGSHIIRGALYYLNRWGEPPLARMGEAVSLAMVLRLLETAAAYDTATGGYRPETRVFPQVVRISAQGIAVIPETALEAVYRTELALV